MAREYKYDAEDEEEEEMELGSQLLGELMKLSKEMTEDEHTVFNKISDTFEEVNYPENLFNEKSIDELNKIFGGHGKMVITGRVRAALNALRILDAIDEAYNEAIPEAKRELERQKKQKE